MGRAREIKGGGKKRRERDENGARSIQPRTRIETREDEGRRMGGEKRRRIRRNKSGEEEREREREERWEEERVYRVSSTRWPSPFIANLLNETCRAYIVRLLVRPPIEISSPSLRNRLPPSPPSPSPSIHSFEGPSVKQCVCVCVCMGSAMGHGLTRY